MGSKKHVREVYAIRPIFRGRPASVRHQSGGRPASAPVGCRQPAAARCHLTAARRCRSASAGRHPASPDRRPASPAAVRRLSDVRPVAVRRPTSAPAAWRHSAFARRQPTATGLTQPPGVTRHRPASSAAARRPSDVRPVAVLRPTSALLPGVTQPPPGVSQPSPALPSRRASPGHRPTSPGRSPASPSRRPA